MNLMFSSIANTDIASNSYSRVGYSSEISLILEVGTLVTDKSVKKSFDCVNQLVVTNFYTTTSISRHFLY